MTQRTLQPARARWLAPRMWNRPRDENDVECLSARWASQLPADGSRCEGLSRKWDVDIVPNIACGVNYIV